MLYLGELSGGQQVYLENQEALTLLTLTSSGPGQQQSQRSSWQTGAWTVPPTIFQTATGTIIRLETNQGQLFLLLQAGGVISPAANPPDLSGARVLPLNPVTSGPATVMSPMQPLPPMQPLKPMAPLPPMEMRMGNMQLQMGTASQAQTPGAFCTQCGKPTESTDRFCAKCGHPLK